LARFLAFWHSLSLSLDLFYCDDDFVVCGWLVVVVVVVVHPSIIASIGMK
jgi:hypothetical protein